MKKFVLKTVFITLGCVIAATVAAYLLCSFCFPRYLAKLYNNLENDQKAVKYMSRVYDRTDDGADLFLLCTYCVKSGDNGLIAEYLGKMTARGDFETVCVEQGDGAKEFISSNYVCALYETGVAVDAVVVKARVLDGGYPYHGALESLIALGVSKEDGDMLEKLRSELVALVVQDLSDDEISRIFTDIVIIDDFLTK